MDYSLSTFEASVVTAIKKSMNIGAAAAELGVPRTTVTTSLSRLEKKLGVLLFKRKQRSGEVMLTEGGIDIVPKLEKIAFIAGTIRSKEKTWDKDRNSGAVTITSTQTLIECFICPYVLPFLRRNPRVSLALRQRDDLSLHDQQINEIFIGSWLEHHQDYHYIPFHSFLQKMWASDDYIKRYGYVTDVDDLSHHRILHQRSVVDPKRILGSQIVDKQLAYQVADLSVFEVAGPRISDVLAEKGVGILIASEETIRLSRLKLSRIFHEMVGDKIDLFVRVDKRFMDAPVARYCVDWIFSCRNKALESIGVETEALYTPYYDDDHQG